MVFSILKEEAGFWPYSTHPGEGDKEGTLE